VAEDLKAEGKKLAADATEAVSGVAAQRKQAAAEYMRAMAAAIERGAGQLEQEGRSGTASVVRQTSEEIEHFAQRILEREPRQLLHDVEDFVRQRPRLSFGVSALAAFGVMRFLKSSGGRIGREDHRASTSDRARREPA
jgi:ElaB/YqjD/DUF883 family membrane-anchored ribosome-binding protein